MTAEIEEAKEAEGNVAQRHRCCLMGTFECLNLLISEVCCPSI